MFAQCNEFRPEHPAGNFTSLAEAVLSREPMTFDRLSQRLNRWRDIRTRRKSLLCHVRRAWRVDKFLWPHLSQVWPHQIRKQSRSRDAYLFASSAVGIRPRSFRYRSWRVLISETARPP